MTKGPENILVSICIPTYNGEKYLRQCLDSCLDQDFKDYEIIICDDGSQDGSIAILESYANMHSQITFVKNEKNLGLVENWNKCISLAKGTWIKFVFQDDYISKDCLQKFVNALNPSSVLLVSERNFILPEKASEDLRTYYKNGVKTLRNTNNQKTNTFSPHLISIIAANNIGMNFIAEPTLTFFRKSAVLQLGNFRDTLKQICDLEFFLRLATVHGLTYIPEKLCSFRIHSDSTTSKNIANKYFELRYMEPLLLVYYLLYDVAFSNFRKELSVLQLLKLNIYFQVKSFQAYKINTEHNHQHLVFSDTEPRFNEIKRYKNAPFWIRILAKINK